MLQKSREDKYKEILQTIYLILSITFTININYINGFKVPLKKIFNSLLLCIFMFIGV